jgi:hypothetical protein
MADGDLPDETKVARERKHERIVRATQVESRTSAVLTAPTHTHTSKGSSVSTPVRTVPASFGARSTIAPTNNPAGYIEYTGIRLDTNDTLYTSSSFPNRKRPHGYRVDEPKTGETRRHPAGTSPHHTRRAQSQRSPIPFRDRHRRGAEAVARTISSCLDLCTLGRSTSQALNHSYPQQP